MSIHIGSFSTGLSSALTVERVLKRHGQCIIVLMDVLIEDDDNYRFSQEMRARWAKHPGATFVTLTEGRTPYEVAEQQKIIPNQKLAPCTFRLKIDMFVSWMKGVEAGTSEHTTNDGHTLPVAYDGSGLIVHIDYDYTEVERCKSTRKNYEAYGWQVDFPLLWRPYELRPYEDVSRSNWGIEPPRMYGMGYSHANCGGMCVKQGRADWTRTLINFPARFAWAEAWEKKMRQHPKRAAFTLLRDQSEGRVRPYSLTRLREEYEADQGPQLSFLDQMSPCIHCGIGDMLISTDDVILIVEESD